MLLNLRNNFLVTVNLGFVPENYLKNQEDLSMAYKISDECIACGACADGCPVSAISEGDGKYVIDADACVDCGACAEACPVGAPKAE